MIDILPDITLSETDKQVLSALLGALLGAIIGALSTFFTSEHARKKQLELNEVEKIRVKIKQSTGSLLAAQNNLHNLLIMTLKNTGHAKDMTKGIYDGDSKLTTFTMNLPQLYKIEPGLSNGMLNTHLVIHWDALETETILHNSNIKEFNDYYTFLRTSIHTAQLTNTSSLNLNTIISDNRTISAGAQQHVAACENFKTRCMKVEAMLELHLKQYSKIDYRTVKLGELEKYQQKLISHKPTDKQVKKKMDELSKKYTEQAAFKVNAHSV